MSSPFAERLLGRKGDRSPALLTEDRTWTWRELIAQAERLAASMRRLKVGERNAMAIAMSRGPELILALCAARLTGALPVLIDPEDPSIEGAVLPRLAPAMILTGRRTRPIAGAWRLDVSGGRPSLDGGEAPKRRTRIWPAGLSHLLFTSGSTGSSKGVVWSELRVVHECSTRVPVGCPDQKSCAGIVAPLCTSLGFHELLRAMWHGVPVALIDRPFPATLPWMEEAGVTGFQCTPTHVDLLLAGTTPLPSQIRRINVSSSPIESARLSAFAQRIAPALVSQSYGLSEIGPVCVLRPGQLARKGHTVGRPVSDRRVRVCDPRGREVERGRPGEIVVELEQWSPLDGYYPEDAERSSRFRNGRLYTGDRGRFDPDGFLLLEARAAELLKVAGRSVSARRIEETIARVLPGARAGVVGVPHPRLGEVPAAFLVEPPRKDDLSPLALALRADELPKWFLPRRRLPLTASGKLRRARLAAEAHAWVSLWSEQIAIGPRLWPARRLASPHGELIVLDGLPPEWTPGARSFAPRAGARAIACARASRMPEPIAVVELEDGDDVTTSGVRVIRAPFAAAAARIEDDLGTALRTTDVFTAMLPFLLRAALALPGERPIAWVVQARTRAGERALERCRFTRVSPRWFARLASGAALPRGLSSARTLRAIARRLCDYVASSRSDA